MKLTADNPNYRELHNVLDNLYRELHFSGIGAQRKQAEVISRDEESILWEKGALSVDTPNSLLNTVFYYNGLKFVLRGGDEHRSLKISQLVFKSVPNPDKPSETIRTVEYTEFGSKNRSGSSKQLNIRNKSVLRYSRPDLRERCHVYLLELYMSKLPKEAFVKDNFYCKPKSDTPSDGSVPWYINLPVGHNLLDRKLKEILKVGGISTENRSNHSLRATAISRKQYS